MATDYESGDKEGSLDEKTEVEKLMRLFFKRFRYCAKISRMG
jgi:hypothetical protein